MTPCKEYRYRSVTHYTDGRDDVVGPWSAWKPLPVNLPTPAPGRDSTMTFDVQYRPVGCTPPDTA